MSVALMTLVFKCNMPELKTDKGETVSDSSCKFVLLALADHASDEGEGAYPGVKSICRKTNLCTQTVVHALNALRYNGFTRLEGPSKRRTFNYSILSSRILRFQWVESSDSTGQNPRIPLARTNPSFNHPTKPPKKPSRAAAPRATDFPEIILFHSVTRRYPVQVNYENVCDAIKKINHRLDRESVADDLTPFFQEWCARGFNPINLGWLDWAISGKLPEIGRRGRAPVDEAARQAAAKDKIKAFVESAS